MHLRVIPARGDDAGIFGNSKTHLALGRGPERTCRPAPYRSVRSGAAVGGATGPQAMLVPLTPYHNFLCGLVVVVVVHPQLFDRSRTDRTRGWN
ncbi:Hypothetical protein NTJ_10023 [Nesidiocoris tenuis]|uniref:Uncharacterized protein n=1 Tax=Nesidiocoris tenuis TaxID=355587 RepID=A0ABN7AYE4_9HEMI|nr:Hypothetical protein NTJ_10023 [Nesidiocoris tenuis]